jgi:acyl-CoA synthetase (AMP-forming)/AMP-acid ligase II
MNIGTLLTKIARTFPDKLAIVHGPKKLTYAQFNARANRMANALNHLGVRQGDKVALLQHNYPQMLESMFACFKAGYGAVPINWRLHPKEFSFIIDHSEAQAVILSPEFNETIIHIRERIPNARHLITLSGAEGELMDYQDLISRGSV